MGFSACTHLGGCGKRIESIRGATVDHIFTQSFFRTELPEFHDIVDTFIAWSDEILGWHHTQRASNGRIEGTNNLLQVLRRTAHGFTNPANFEARGLLIT